MLISYVLNQSSSVIYNFSSFYALHYLEFKIWSSPHTWPSIIINPKQLSKLFIVNTYASNIKKFLVKLTRLIILFPIFIHTITPIDNTIICNY
jgi:hypothetical protein